MRKIKLTFLLGMFLASLPAIAQTEEDAKNAALDFLKQKKGNAKLELSSSKLDVGTTSANAKSVLLRSMPLMCKVVVLPWFAQEMETLPLQDIQTRGVLMWTMCLRQ